MSINIGQLEAGIAGRSLGYGLQRGQGANPNFNQCYGTGYFYNSLLVCEDCCNIWKILLWVLGGLLLAAAIISGIVALALIPVYIGGSTSRAPARTVLAGPRGRVNTMSALRNSLVTTTEDGSVTFWDASNNRNLRTIRPGSIARQRQISPANIATIGPGQTVSFWNQNGPIRQAQLNQFGSLNDILVSKPNEIYIGTGTGRLLLLDSNGNVVQNLANTGGAAISGISQLANGDIVTVDANKNINIWRNNAILRTFAGSTDTGSISNLEVSNGLATQSLFYTIGSKLYQINAETGQLIRSIQSSGAISNIRALNNGALGVANDKTVYYYDMESGNQIRTADTLENTITSLTSNANNIYAGTTTGDIISLANFPLTINPNQNVLSGPDGVVNAMSVLGNSLVTTSSAGTLSFWDAKTRQLKGQINSGLINSLSQISPQNVVAIGSDQSVSFWNLNGRTSRTLLNQFGTLNEIFVQSLDQIYITTSTGRLLLLDSTGRVVQNLANTGGAAISGISQLANGDIVTVDANKNINIWRNNAILRTFAGSTDTGSISNLEVSNGLATQSLFYTIGSKLYQINAETGQLIRSIDVSGVITNIQALNNGAVAIVTGRNIYFYDMNTGNQIRTADTLENTITSLTSNANNIYAGTTTGDIISLANFPLTINPNQNVLSGPDGVVNAMSVLGNSLVTTSSAGTLSFWDANTRLLKRTFDSGILNSLTQFSPENVVAIGSDQSVSFWNLNGRTSRTLLTQFGTLNDIYVQSPDQIYITTSTGRLLLLDSTGRVVQNLANTGDAVITEVSQLANGDIVTVDANKNINIWRNNAILRTFAGSTDTGSISNIEVSNGLTTQSFIYSIGSRIYLVNAADGQLIRSFDTPGTITNMQALNNGGVAVAIGRTVYYYNLNDGNQLRAPDIFDNLITSLTSNSNNIYAGTSTGNIVSLPNFPSNTGNQVILSGPAGLVNILSIFENVLITATSGTITLWDATTLQPTNSYNSDSITSLRQISSNTWATINNEQFYSFWNLNGATNSVLLNQFGLIKDIFVNSPNEIYAGTNNGRLLILDSNGNVVQNLDNTNAAAINSISRLTNGDIVTVDANKNINVWRNNAIIATFAGSADPGIISNFAVSNGLAVESFIYTIGSTLYLANAADGSLIRSFDTPGIITNIEPINNGAVAVSTGRAIYYYNLNTGNQIRPSDTLDYTVTGLVSNARSLFTGTNIGNIFAIDPFTGSNFNA